MHRCLVGLVVCFFIVVGNATAEATVDSKPVVVPVLPCKTEFGVDGTIVPWAPSNLPVALSKQVAARLSFYSNGFLTVLAPKGWACTGTVGASGGVLLSVFPPGQADPNATLTTPSNAAAVVGETDYTGHRPGAQTVCDLFPGTPAYSFGSDVGGCPTPPKRQRSEHATADVVTFFDPPHVKGSGYPSGGTNPASGVVIYPQIIPDPGSVNVAKETCTLPRRTRPLCATIIADFTIRAFPAQP